jgi:hypothetical protein
MADEQEKNGRWKITFRVFLTDFEQASHSHSSARTEDALVNLLATLGS